MYGTGWSYAEVIATPPEVVDRFQVYAGVRGALDKEGGSYTPECHCVDCAAAGSSE